LIVLAAIIYVIIHGTDNLKIVNKINSFCNVIPIFSGVESKTRFLKNYIVDAMWFVSLLLIASVFRLDKRIASVMACVFASFLEFTQFIFPELGTFDIFDVLLYIFITFFHIILTIVIERLKRRAWDRMKEKML